MHVADFYSLFLSCGQAFSTDSRRILRGGVFFALKGANFNGNEFAQAALRSGAAFAVVDEVPANGDERIIAVHNVLEFMQELATHHRKQFDIPILAVGGSNGKTTTKELLRVTLSVKFKVHATEGNFNNLIGVPITLLQMPVDTEFAVIEIGTNQFGEIEKLCSILQPNYGLITNIGKEHLEGFGDIEGVTREESSLYLHLLEHGGLAFVNADDPILQNMARRLPRTYSYALSHSADYSGSVRRAVPEIEMSTISGVIRSPLTGIYNAQNILASAAIAHYFDVPGEGILEAIEGYRGGQNRSEYIRSGEIGILLDAYNANPSSVEVTLRSFSEFPAEKKLILLGDMLELGNSAIQEHAHIVDLAQSIPNSELCLVGPLFREAARGRDFPTFEDVAELNLYLRTRSWTGYEILIKGSRGIRMERALEAIQREGTEL